MKNPRQSSASERAEGDAEAMGAILSEVIRRLRDGETPRVEEYIAKFPQFEGVLRDHFQVLGLLEGQDFGASGGVTSGEEAAGRRPPSLAGRLGPTIAALPERLQRVIFLRNFEKLRWSEIARQVGQPEEDLRREYAAALRELVECCSAPAGDYGESR